MGVPEVFPLVELSVAKQQLTKLFTRLNPVYSAASFNRTTGTSTVILFDLVILNTYFRIERSGLPRHHRDIWRDEAGGLNIYFMGLYFLVAEDRPTKRGPAVQA